MTYSTILAKVACLDTLTPPRTIDAIHSALVALPRHPITARELRRALIHTIQRTSPHAH